MLLTVVAILILLWLIGLLANIGGGFIHILLIVAVVVFIWDHTIGRRRLD
jgi:4-hydroxybenzoate polyprenyltransferase